MKNHDNFTLTMPHTITSAEAQFFDVAAWSSRVASSAAVACAVVSVEGDVQTGNPAWAEIFEKGRLPKTLHALVLEVALHQRCQWARLALPCGSFSETQRRIDVTALPVGAALVMLMAKDTTLDANLVSALSASRRLFRDLSSCSNDFAFETDAHAHFSYVSTNGLLGYSGSELHGARPRVVFGDPHLAALFSCKRSVQRSEIWTKSKSGAEACLVVSAVPILDSQGAWCGTRGVAQDLTTMRLQERALVAARARDDLVQAIAAAIRAQVDPRRMMLAAGDAIAGAIHADCVLLRAENCGREVAIGKRSPRMVEVQLETLFNTKGNGYLVAGRDAQKGDFSNDEHALLEAVVPHLGIAFELISLMGSRGGASC